MENEILLSEFKKVVAQFENGQARYDESPTFKTVVNALARGANPISIIDSLVKFIDSQNNQLEKLIKKSGPYSAQLKNQIEKSNEEIPNKL